MLPDVTQDVARSTVSTAPCGDERITIRLLGTREHAAAVDLALEAFAGNEFYESVLGLGGSHFRAYWEEFLRMALRSNSARVYGIEWDGALRGMIVAAFHGFPSARSGVRFLSRLLWRIGPIRWWRYVAFVLDYDRAVRVVEMRPSHEARCYWLMVAPGCRRRLGPALVAGVRRALAEEDKERAVGFIDASNERLVNFYRRQGFRVGVPIPFRGRRAATITIATGLPSQRAPC